MTDQRRIKIRASRDLGPISDGRTWRTSTAIPDAICFVAHQPFRFLAWLVRAIMILTRTIILTTAAIIGALLVISGALTGWQEGTLGILCLICTGAVAFSVSRREKQVR